MNGEVTSLTEGVSTELIVKMPLKKGFVETRGTVSYATRTRLILAALHKLVKTSLEQNAKKAFAGPIDRLRIVEDFHWSIIDDKELLLSVNFKGAWEPYIRKIAEAGGPVLDIILCGCEGYEDYTTDKGYGKFAEWARKYQVQNGFFYSAMPDMTSDDFVYARELLEKLETTQNPVGFDLESTQLSITDPSVKAGDLRAHPTPQELLDILGQTIRTLTGLYQLRDFFPGEDGIYLGQLAHSTLDDIDVEALLTGANPQLGVIFAKQINWYKGTPKRAVVNNPREPIPDDLYSQLAEVVQGNILSNYQNMTHSNLLLVQIVDPSRSKSLLNLLKGLVTTEKKYDDRIKSNGTGAILNFAITYQGLKTIGLSKKNLSQFPKEFREGMQARASSLGDVHSNHPDNWSLPLLQTADVQDPPARVQLNMVDLVIQLQHESAGLTSEINALTTQLQNLGAIVLVNEELQRQFENGLPKGHFGFVDGISQPEILRASDPALTGSYNDKIHLGDLLLGHNNLFGDPPKTSALFSNSTFSVVRKLKQNVGRFDDLAPLGSSAKGSSELAEKMMGRTKAGVSAYRGPTGSQEFKPVYDPLTRKLERNNGFDYQGDDLGLQCPLASHARRANPRDGKRNPRILRRGFSYGPDHASDPSAERGLMFMAFNASIADQFEVIQQWMSGGNSTGVHSSFSDPFLGVAKPGESRVYRYTSTSAGTPSVERILLNDPSFAGPDPDPLVKLQWGMYLFVPSITALTELERLALDDDEPEEALMEKARHHVSRLIEAESLLRLCAPADRKLAVIEAWKKLFEDLAALSSGLTEAVAEVISQDHGGVLKTSYATIVTREDLVKKVFWESKTTANTNSHYSVAEYGRRMDQSTGVNYLGIDRTLDGRYDRESKVPNELSVKVSVDESFIVAYNGTKKLIEDIKTIYPAGVRILLPMRKICDEMLGALAQYWFGIPDGQEIIAGEHQGDDKLYCPSDFLDAGRYIFSPNPTAYTVAQGKLKGAALQAATKRFVARMRQQNALNGIDNASIFKGMMNQISDDDQVSRTIVGLVQGFVAPTYGHFLNSMIALIQTGGLWRLQHLWCNEIAKADGSGGLTDEFRAQLRDALIKPAVLKAMAKNPFPDLLHRTLDSEYPVDLGDTTIFPDEKLVMRLASKSNKDTEITEIAFGGNYDQGLVDEAGGHDKINKPAHACPGKDMALGILYGMVAGLLETGELKKEARTVLSTSAKAATP